MTPFVRGRSKLKAPAPRPRSRTSAGRCRARAGARPRATTRARGASAPRRRGPSPSSACPAGGAAPPVAALRGRDLLGRDGLRELRDLAGEEVAHALLLAPDPLRELRGLPVAHDLGEVLDRGVRRDLLGLILELRLGVLQEPLLLAGSAKHVNRALERGNALARNGNRPGDALGHRVGAGHVHVARLAAELLDAAFDVARVRLRLTQVLLEAAAVGRARGHRDVGLERRLLLLLLPVGLVQELDQLQVLGLYVRHAELPLPCVSLAIRVPVSRTRTRRTHSAR